MNIYRQKNDLGISLMHSHFNKRRRKDKHREINLIPKKHPNYLTKEEKAMKAKKKRVVIKDPTEIKAFISLLTVENGLSIAEVRKARAGIRRIAANKEANFNPYSKNLLGAFYWKGTKEGHSFWKHIGERMIKKSI